MMSEKTKELKIGYSLKHKILLEQFCAKHLEHHPDCAERLSDVYSRFQDFTENKTTLRRRYFKAILMKYLKQKYGENITDQAVNVGVIINGVGLVPEDPAYHERI